MVRHFPELSDKIRYATVPRSQKDEGRMSPPASQSPTRTVDSSTPEKEAETEEGPWVVNGVKDTVEDDSEKAAVFENDGGASADQPAPVTTRINRRRASSLRSIRKRLSVQRRSTIGVGDNRNLSDDNEDVQNEVIIFSGAGLNDMLAIARGFRQINSSTIARQGKSMTGLRSIL